jgi:hypothetical protein
LAGRGGSGCPGRGETHFASLSGFSCVAEFDTGFAVSSIVALDLASLVEVKLTSLSGVKLALLVAMALAMLLKVKQPSLGGIW